ncbi:MAG TPA: MerR family transcriptional regulator, partial [Draconibacterium sp.]|nr:MerR family transcriptional regulator [Draconibacterium sp.]
LEVLSGIKAHTIRIWEKRYDLLNPQRTETNIRFYTDDDLRKILNVSLLVRHGFKISKVARWSDEKIREAILDLTHSGSSESDYVDQLLMYMINFDDAGFTRVTNEVIDKMGMEEAISKVFFKLFVGIGTFWQVGSIFPAQEHFVTNIFRQKLIVEIDKLVMSNEKRATILFYLPENEYHELSLLFYSYLAQKYGYHVIYLGQTVPFDDLKKIGTQIQIDYIFSAFIHSVEKEELENYLNELKKLFSHQKIFVTGGQIQHYNPQLPRIVKVIKDYHDFKKYLL